jgi:hypothetical protein
MGILAGLTVSANFGLFGFKEALSTSYAGEPPSASRYQPGPPWPLDHRGLVKDRSGRATD